MNDNKSEQKICEAEPLQDHQAKQEWLAENSEAIEAYNRSVELHGAFSDGLRSF